MILIFFINYLLIKYKYIDEKKKYVKKPTGKKKNDV